MDDDADSKFSRRPGCSNRSGSLDRHRLLASGSPSGPRRSRPNFAQRINFAEPQMNDVRFAFRKLRQAPAFTFIAIVTLALGIGLNTTIFSLINDLFLRGLPFKEPSRIVHLDNGDKGRDLADVGLSAPRYQLYRDGQTLFDGFAAENSAAQNSSPFTLTGLGDPVQIFGGRVTSNYFDVLGVRPILGRNFLPEEEESADVALVTKNFW